MKKVLILTSVASMIKQFNMDNIEVLLGLGYEVHVAANFIHGNNLTNSNVSELKEELSALGVKWYQIEFQRNIYRVFRNIKAYRTTKKLLQEQKYNIIHCQSPVGGVCCRMVSGIKNTKKIYTAHGFHFYKGAPLLNWLIYYPVEKLLANRNDVLITINSEDFLIGKRLGTKMVEYVPGIGIESKKYADVTVDITGKRKELGITEGNKVLLSVGEVNKNKNHLQVIKALSILKRSDISYIVCGIIRDKKLYKKIQEFINRNNLKNNVIFTGFRNDLPELYKSVDILIHPSIREGLPMAPMEAMASGLPVLASDIRGNRDLISDNITGLLFNLEDPMNIAKKIQYSLENPELIYKLATKAQEKIKEFGNDIVMVKMKNIYKRILQ